MSYFIKPNLKWAFSVLLFFVSVTTSMAQKHTVRVVDQGDDNSPLYGASIYFMALESGAISNMNGNFNLYNNLSGDFQVRISYVGYEPQVITLSFPLKESVEIGMVKSFTELDNVTISGESISDFKKENQTSTVELDAVQLKRIPQLMGEPDLIRVVQNLPGVKTESDLSSGFSVRGGRNDQNLILLDNVPVYNPWHLFGVFSAFNNEAVQSVELSKGIFPAQYGGRLSSVLDIELQDGHTRQGAGYLTVTPISASFSYGKTISDKTSVLFAIRRTYVDPILFLIGKSQDVKNDYEEYSNRFNYMFMDFNAKVTHRFSQSSKLDLGLFFGQDNLRTKSTTTYPNAFSHPNELIPETHDRLDFGWKNTTVNLRYLYNRAVFSSTSQVYLTKYDVLNQSIENQINGTRFSDGDYVARESYENEKFTQNLYDLGFNQDFGFHWSDNVELHLGTQWQYHHYKEENLNTTTVMGADQATFIEDPVTLEPDYGNIEIEGYNIYEPLEVKKYEVQSDESATNPLEVSTYARLSMTFGKLNLYPGIRYHYYSEGQFSNLLPRINVNYQLTKKINITAGYGHFTQYLQAVGLDFIRIPSERWFWSDENRPPAMSKSYTAGVGVDLNKWGKVTVEGYYKDIDGLLNFSIKGQSTVLDSTIPHFPNETISGTGESYGAEVYWSKTDGPLTGWLGYTLSWSWNQFEELNDNSRFPTRTDQRHVIQAYGNWDFHPNWSLGLLFNYKSGQPITFSTGLYLHEEDPLGIGQDFTEDVSVEQVIVQRNDFRLPDYHRLDVSITWKNRRMFKHKSEISLNIMNVYNHINTLTVNGSNRFDLLPYKQLRVYPNNIFYGQLPILPVLSFKIGLGKDLKWKD